MADDQLPGLPVQININLLQPLIDGAGVLFICASTKANHGDVVYALINNQWQACIDPGTWGHGGLAEEHDGTLTHVGTDQNGNLVRTKNLPHWTPRTTGSTPPGPAPQNVQDALHLLSDYLKTH